MTTTGFDPRAVANLLLSAASQRGIRLTNVSVQKLLYFAHASFWVQFRRPLVNGVFEAWEYGPVCRAVYDALKQHGRSPIVDPIKRSNPFTGQGEKIAEIDDADAIFHVQNVIRTMGHLSASDLIELSHRPGGAWDEVWNKSKTKATIGNRIDDKLTLERFYRLKMPMRPQSQDGDIDEAAPLAGD